MGKEGKTIIFPEFTEHSIPSYLRMRDMLSQILYTAPIEGIVVKLNKLSLKEIDIYMENVLYPVYLEHKPQIVLQCGRDDESKITKVIQFCSKRYIVFKRTRRTVTLPMELKLYEKSNN